MKFIIFITILLFFLTLVSAETTFFSGADNEAFIVGDVNSIPSVNSEGTASGGGGCLTNWACSPWSDCNEGVQIRSCTKEKIGCYADVKNKPVENKSCLVTVNNTFPDETGFNGEKVGMNLEKVILSVLGLVVILAAIILFTLKYKKKYIHRYYNN